MTNLLTATPGPWVLREPVTDELDLLAHWVPLDKLHVVELGCGAAAMARALLARCPGARVSAFDVDTRQLARLQAEPVARLTVAPGGAQQVPLADGVADMVWMLKSLHHVPVPDMDQALREARRLLRPGGWLCVSEPVYGGLLNEIVRQFNDEGRVRAEAQRAVDRALAGGGWVSAAECWFEMPVSWSSFEEFEARMMHPTHTEHRLDEAVMQATRAAWQRLAPGGALQTTRPQHLRLLQRV